MKELFDQWSEDIVEWNLVARDYDESDYDHDLQRDLCKEEFKEAFEAYESGDEEEFISEVCDLFVVMSYYYNREFGHCPSYTTYLKTYEDYGVQYVRDIKGLLNTAHGMFEIGRFSPYRYVRQILAQYEKAESIMTAKLLSNWSKLPTTALFRSEVGYTHLRNDLEKECLAIEERSNGRYSGVTYQLVAGKEPRLVFQANTGKIVKPCTYHDWREYL